MNKEIFMAYDIVRGYYEAFGERILMAAIKNELCVYVNEQCRRLKEVTWDRIH